jgi:hypothetical protein
MDGFLIGKIFLVILSLIIISGISFLWIKKRTGNEFFGIMLIFWSSILIISLKPEILESVLNTTGLVNRSQFLFSVSLILIMYLMYRQNKKSRNSISNYKEVIRKIALESFKREYYEEIKNTDIIIIICAKNEEKTIGEIINDIKNQPIKESYKILVVNDGSNDNTEANTRKFEALIINHFENLGIGGAIKTGYLASKFFNPKIVINIDADGQHDPAYITKIISKINNENFDLVYVSRFAIESQYKTNKIRSFGNKFYTNLINKIGNLSITDVTTGYRAIKFSKLSKIFFVSESNFAIELALRAGKNKLKVTEISSITHVREHGQSQFYKIEKFLMYNLIVLRQIYYANFIHPKFESKLKNNLIN